MELEIHFGCLAEPIFDQVDSQGLKLSYEKAYELQQYADAIESLYMADLLNEKEKASVQKKLFTQIKKSVRIKKGK